MRALLSLYGLIIAIQVFQTIFSIKRENIRVELEMELSPRFGFFINEGSSDKWCKGKFYELKLYSRSTLPFITNQYNQEFKEVCVLF
jgi:hypothetical protein